MQSQVEEEDKNSGMRGKCDYGGKIRNAVLLALKLEMGAWAKEGGQLLEAEKGKEIDSPLEPPDRSTALPTQPL